MKRAAIYARVSTDDQDVDTQVSFLKAQVDRGIQVGGVHEPLSYYGAFIDEDRTGHEYESRERFMDALSQAGKYDVLLVTKLDRFTRNVRDGIILLERFNEAGALVWTTDLGVLDVRAPSNWLTVMIQLVFAEFEVRLIRYRTWYSLDQKRKTGTLKGLQGRPRKCKEHGVSERDCGCAVERFAMERERQLANRIPPGELK